MPTPSASSMSALPQRLETERLPCLMTGTPQAAVRSAVPVEMLKLPEASPPVPTMSMARRLAGIPVGRARRRMACARPKSSCATTPLVESAASSAPAMAGGVCGSVSCASNASAWAAERSRRSRSCCSSSRGADIARSTADAQEIAEQSWPLGRENAFRMELHALDAKGAVAHTHDLPCRGLGADFQYLWQRCGRGDE